MHHDDQIQILCHGIAYVSRSLARSANPASFRISERYMAEVILTVSQPYNWCLSVDNRNQQLVTGSTVYQYETSMFGSGEE